MTDIKARVIDTIDLTDEVAGSAQIDRKLASRVISMFEEGFTVPFIARYRKEVTGGMEPATLHRLKEKINSCKMLIEKIDKSFQYFSKQGLLTEDLSRQLKQCKSTEEVKLLVQPLKPKGPRTLSARAKAANLEPVAMEILQSSHSVDLFQRAPPEALKAFGCGSSLQEAVCHVIADVFAKDLELVRHAEMLCIRHPPTMYTTRKQCRAKQESKKNKNKPGNLELMDVDSDDSAMDTEENPSATQRQNFTKDDLVTFKNYLQFSRITTKLHAHQILAINRAADRGVITVRIVLPPVVQIQSREFMVRKYFPSIHRGNMNLVHSAFSDAWKRLIEPHLIRGIRSRLTAQAQDTSLDVFSENLRRRLMTAPLRAPTTPVGGASHAGDPGDGVISSSSAAPGDRLPVVGLDPGWRHGCKWAACDPHGDVISTGIVWPPTTMDLAGQLFCIVSSVSIQTIALGNGQGSRQTGRWLAELITMGHFRPLSVRFAVVSEAGASWYSASELATSEMPNLDVSLRGAVSIARRLQDPLSELVKVEPKHLGVGMYQHDLPEKRLVSAVNALMEECISFVGVDLNAAPLHILSRISGLSEAKAKAIAEYRSQVGAFRTRNELLKVKGIGPTTFAQCAGFVRIRPTYSTVKLDGSKDVDMISISSEDDHSDLPVCPGSKRKRPTLKPSKRKQKQPRTVPDVVSFNPLDQTAVHPDTYDIARNIIDSLGFELPDVGTVPLRQKASALFKASDRDERLKRFCVNNFGLDTVRDIVEALSRPLDFDEREDHFLPLFHSSAMSLTDLKPGMRVSGRVENVTTFGAFCDIGVQQDAYIPRHLYPRAKQTSADDGLFTLRLGDRISAVVGEVQVAQGRITASRHLEYRSNWNMRRPGVARSVAWKQTRDSAGFQTLGYPELYASLIGISVFHAAVCEHALFVARQRGNPIGLVVTRKFAIQVAFGYLDPTQTLRYGEHGRTFASRGWSRQNTMKLVPRAGHMTNRLNLKWIPVNIATPVGFPCMKKRILVTADMVTESIETDQIYFRLLGNGSSDVFGPSVIFPNCEKKPFSGVARLDERVRCRKTALKAAIVTGLKTYVRNTLFSHIPPSASEGKSASHRGSGSTRCVAPNGVHYGRIRIHVAGQYADPQKYKLVYCVNSLCHKKAESSHVLPMNQGQTSQKSLLCARASVTRTGKPSNHNTEELYGINCVARSTKVPVHNSMPIPIAKRIDNAPSFKQT
ncbi:S1 RNA-binding domain-containing protein 1 [Clonorchis sinensis]|uniref:S1 RNA-binding domain-containing protein 1 n=1 Tax=Clonorchis sinensis TaxID=79923 RepID=G7YCY4_CLOSI|nr:S1 RNA-binding domain-containing protein 1 [Clonorchis sinensis]